MSIVNANLKKYRFAIIIFLLIAGPLIVYSPVRHSDFVDYDDGAYVTDNPTVQRGVTSDGVIWAFTSGFAANWHPLTWISHMLDCQLYGLNPAGHHLTSLLLHALNTLLLFLVFHRMTGAVWQSAFIAAIFALHPLHVESVAWVSERKDVLSTFFGLLTMLMYVSYVKDQSRIKYLLVLLLFGLGLLAKPMLVTLPFVLLLLDFWPLRRIHLAGSKDENGAALHNGLNTGTNKSAIVLLIREKMPLFAMTVASSVVTFIVQRRGGAVRTLEVLPLLSRIANAALSYLRYIEKSFWPSGLAVFYPYNIQLLSIVSVAIAVLVLVVVSYIAIRTLKNKPYVIVGWLWYLGALVPVIGIVQVGSSAMNDRYMYVPLIGLSVIVAWGVSDLLKTWALRNLVLSFSAMAVLLALGACSSQQVLYWQDTIAIFEQAERVTQNNHVAYSNVAIALTKQGKIEEALEHYRQSLRINPSSAETNSNMGSALIRLGRIEEATRYCAEAVHLRSDFPLAQYNLAYCLAALGDIPEAIDHYAEAIRLKPDYADARLNLANLLARYGSPGEAEAQFSELLRTNPRFEKGYLAKGYLYAIEGNLEDAVTCYTKALEIKPDFAEVHYCLGLVLAHQGKITDAVQHFGEAVRLKPDYAAARTALEAALRQRGEATDQLKAP